MHRKGPPMKTRFLWLPIIGLVAAVALLAGLSIGGAQAAPPQPATSEDLKLDDAAVAQIRDIAKRSEAFLTRNADGTLKLQVAKAADIGASDKFLADYQ